VETLIDEAEKNFPITDLSLTRDTLLILA